MDPHGRKPHRRSTFRSNNRAAGVPLTMTEHDVLSPTPRHAADCSHLYFVLSWLLLFLSGTCSAFELEAFQNHPGTRAMGMAGVFAAQADDSSAIWYNPAGPAFDTAAKSDISIEVGNIPRVSDQDEYSRSGEKLKYLGGYTQKQFSIFGTEYPMAVGAGYFVPDSPTIYIDALRPAVSNPSPYGNVDITNYQVSALLAASPRASFSWGVTVDAMWSEILKCRDYNKCVKKSGPQGYGASLGAKYTVAKFSSGDASIATAWHSRIRLRYASHPDSGIGSVIEDYLPGRPNSFVLGINLRTSTSMAAININAQMERIGWSDTTSDTSISDHRKVGLGTEALFPLLNDNIFALRVGISRALASGTPSKVNILATSIGYGFAQYHSIDIALERRALSVGAHESFVSLSME